MNICWFIKKETNQHLTTICFGYIWRVGNKYFDTFIWKVFYRCQILKRKFDKLQDVPNNPKP